jgi:hypothetical protein
MTTVSERRLRMIVMQIIGVELVVISILCILILNQGG